MDQNSTARGPQVLVARMADREALVPEDITNVFLKEARTKLSEKS